MKDSTKWTLVYLVNLLCMFVFTTLSIELNLPITIRLLNAFWICPIIFVAFKVISSLTKEIKAIRHEKT